MDDNLPYGFEDPGLKMTRQSKANSTDMKDKNFREQFKNFPQTPQEAEAISWKLSQSEKPIDYEKFN